jgi:hypothetical protein
MVDTVVTVGVIGAVPDVLTAECGEARRGFYPGFAKLKALDGRYARSLHLDTEALRKPCGCGGPRLIGRLVGFETEHPETSLRFHVSPPVGRILFDKPTPPSLDGVTGSVLGRPAQ